LKTVGENMKNSKPSDLTAVWRLRNGADRRIRGRHPWVFSNELNESPKGHPQGAPITLLDFKGQFLAHGYGNPQSLISFRALSFKQNEKDICQPESIRNRLLKIWWQRKQLGYESSFRLCYGEGDFLPGLVMDRYLAKQMGKDYQVLAVQIVTAGMSVILKDELRFFSELVAEAYRVGLSPFDWDHTAVVMRNDVSVRKLEGLDMQSPTLIKAIDGVELSAVDIELNSKTLMQTDLIGGQKTGFFLDQAYNIQLLCRQLEKMNWKADDVEGAAPVKRVVKVLDLCCYVGQWSTEITRTLKKMGLDVEVTAVDVSEKALVFAKHNIERQGAVVNIRQLDVLNDLGTLPDRYFDIVIADPPAFIKAKKDVPTGRHAYLKLNTSAFKLAKNGGLVVSCSCSGLFVESEMIDTLRKATQRTEIEARCILHGGHSADHPVLLSFGEGFYLKMFVHHILV